jgi:hypothetical protein
LLFKASLFFLNRYIFIETILLGGYCRKISSEETVLDSKLEKFKEEKTKIFEFSIWRVLAYHFVKRSNLQLSLIHIKKSACCSNIAVYSFLDFIYSIYTFINE